MRIVAAALIALPLAGVAQQPHEREIQRALIELDQRTAAFARGEAPAPLPATVGLPLHPDPVIARELRPYERITVAREHELRLPPPVLRRPVRDTEVQAEKPLPLPGGPRSGVDLVTLPRSAD